MSSVGDLERERVGEDRSEFCVNRIFNTRSVMKIKALRLCVFARKHYFGQSQWVKNNAFTNALALPVFALAFPPD